jgi:5-methylcytosine-specific restriction protein A
LTDIEIENAPPRRHGWGSPTQPAQRGYGGEHLRIRRQLLKDEPNCRICGAKATHADHIIPKCMGGLTVRENYQALCEKCSRSKSGQEGAMMRWKRRGRPGLDRNGR